jgi:endonuclease YncB( thermonuclease family)
VTHGTTTPQATARRISRRTGALVLSSAIALAGVAAVQSGASPAEAAKSSRVLTDSSVTMAVETGANRKPPKLKTREKGRARLVSDGDTLWVKLDGRRPKGAKTHKGWVSVRLAAVQAAETKHKNAKGSRNWCHGIPAKKALRKIVKKKRVVLKSLKKSSRASGGRLQRHVFVKHKGKLTDVATVLLREGHVMSHPMKPEWSQNAYYTSLMQGAMAARKNMWDDDKCGFGPQQDVALKTYIVWDAPGFDDQNVNGEYVVVQNPSTQTLSLNGWKLRDTSLEVFSFPSWAKIPPGGFIKVFTGSGTNTADKFYWGIGHNMWQNPDSQGYADTAVLMDPQGDFRSHFTYPCFSSCADPLSGKLRISEVNYDAEGDDSVNVNGEWIRVTNVSRETLDLGGYYIQRGAFVKMPFRPLQKLRAGDSITIHMGKGQDSYDRMYFGESTSVLNNSGSSVSLANWNGVRIDCSRWGSGRC